MVLAPQQKLAGSLGSTAWHDVGLLAGQELALGSKEGDRVIVVNVFAEAGSKDESISIATPEILVNGMAVV